MSSFTKKLSNDKSKRVFLTIHVGTAVQGACSGYSLFGVAKMGEITVLDVPRKQDQVEEPMIHCKNI